MPLITTGGHLPVKPFAAVPALGGLPEIPRPLATVSNLSPVRGPSWGVDLAEGCFLTKSVKYTHQLAHWVSCGHCGDVDPIDELIEWELCIIPYEGFSISDPCNLVYFEAFVHISLNLYAFIAITASSSTLDNLIMMVKSNNNCRQQEMDERGVASHRLLNFAALEFTNPEYELVALHPEHFLPNGSLLTVYDPATATPKHYVPACDRCLRESCDPRSAPFPPFHHSMTRPCAFRSNVFLIILNAEIKFHRYFKMIEEHPPPTPLPDDVLDLMHRTIELVNLLYWVPVPVEGSQGEAIYLSRSMESDPMGVIKNGSSEKMEMEGAGIQPPTSPCGQQSRWEDMDLEERKAYGRALMSGHDCDYDPALFEDAFPINDDSWNKGVAPQLEGCD
ncbi:hypothetical protein BS47DRAFT_1372848 [Hydnum rufescens UP504]|uniref:Uncharacterized protein n=1 Tax=Hydnum rufescens UP504 TaxID=1448309 RepID=A0A9P6AVS2_9AGAM|nr:hypothetical protein BS47DRAFT_1372848 [Hydnum rufescens UP504]